MPRVSATLASSAACGCRSAALPPVRRCRSSTSLTRSNSSLTTPPTVLSRSELRPDRLPRACSSSAWLGVRASSPNACRSASSCGCASLVWATRYSSWRVGSWLATPWSELANWSSAWAWRTARATPAKAARSAWLAASAPSRRAAAVEDSTHSMRRVVSCSAFSSSAAAAAASSTGSPGAPCSGQVASARSNRAWATAWRSWRWLQASGAGSGTCSGSGRLRSGANSTLSLSPAAPRAARRSLSRGSSTIGMSRWPFCSRSR